MPVQLSAHFLLQQVKLWLVLWLILPLPWSTMHKVIDMIDITDIIDITDMIDSSCNNCCVRVTLTSRRLASIISDRKPRRRSHGCWSGAAAGSGVGDGVLEVSWRSNAAVRPSILCPSPRKTSDYCSAGVSSRQRMIRCVRNQPASQPAQTLFAAYCTQQADATAEQGLEVYTGWWWVDGWSSTSGVCSALFLVVQHSV